MTTRPWYIESQSILDSAQDVTDSWVNLGDAIDCRGFLYLGIWPVVTINNSSKVRIRALAYPTSDQINMYNIYLNIILSTKIELERAYYEIKNDASQRGIIQICTNNIIPFVQLQVQAKTVGATAASIDKIYATRGG